MDQQSGAGLGWRAACPAERWGVKEPLPWVGEAWGAGWAGAAVFTRVPSVGVGVGGVLEESPGNPAGPSVSAKENSGLRHADLSLARLWEARLHL